MSQLRDLARAHERRIAAAVAAHQGGRLAAWTRAQHADPDRELVALLCGPLLIVILTKRGVPAHEAWRQSQRAQQLADAGELTAVEGLLRGHGVDLHDDLLNVAVAGIAGKARAWVRRWGMRTYVEDLGWVDASEEDEDADFGDFEDGDGSENENGGESGEPRARANGALTAANGATAAAAAPGFSDGLFDAANDEPTTESGSPSTDGRSAAPQTDSFDDVSSSTGSGSPYGLATRSITRTAPRMRGLDGRKETTR